MLIFIQCSSVYGSALHLRPLDWQVDGKEVDNTRFGRLCNKMHGFKFPSLLFHVIIFPVKKLGARGTVHAIKRKCPQLRLVVFYSFFPVITGFYTSQVVQDFFHQQ